MSAETPAPKRLIIKPIVISNKQKMVIKSPRLLANFKLPAKTVQQYKEEVIYSSRKCDFLKGESQDVVIVNRLNLISKSCRTIARCSSRGVSVETTSDSVSSVIGQKNYETVLSALSSVFNEETKIRGIVALLTAQKKLNTTASQTDMSKPEAKLVDTACQTVDTRLNMFAKEKQRKRIRRQPLAPYVVTEANKLKKFVINIDVAKKDSQKVKREDTSNLPDLKTILDDESNMSTGSVGNISLSGLSNVSDSILSNTNKFLMEIDKVTDKTLNSTFILLRDGSKIMVPRKPEDIFHIAAPDILKNVTHEERLKLMCHQAFIDFKMCLEQDEDGYYPLHVAVLNNDVDLVRRQCASLRARRESVDIPAGGLTALHMAVRQNVSVDCTKILLQHGADPLLCDQERRCSFHLAAEVAPQLQALINYCDTHARSVLKNNLDFWRPEHESKTDAELKRHLYECVSGMFDEQGYTPLMVAAEAAAAASVRLLAARAGRGVDAPAPPCGATALYRAVTKACLHAAETGNRTTAPDNILKTIEILVEYGANPSVENHAGSSVNTLLTEFNISALSMTIANKMTSIKHGTSNDNMMLYKYEDGNIGWLCNGDEDIKPEVNEVTNYPANLHAIITVDVPKRPCCGRKFVPDSKAIFCCGRKSVLPKSPTSTRQDGNDERNNGKFVDLKEMPLKVVTGKTCEGNESKQENVLIKNGTKNDTNLKVITVYNKTTKQENVLIKNGTNNNTNLKVITAKTVCDGNEYNKTTKQENVLIKNGTNNDTNLKVITAKTVCDGNEYNKTTKQENVLIKNGTNNDTNLKVITAKTVCDGNEYNKTTKQENVLIKNGTNNDTNLKVITAKTVCDGNEYNKTTKQENVLIKNGTDNDTNLKVITAKTVCDENEYNKTTKRESVQIKNVTNLNEESPNKSIGVVKTDEPDANTSLNTSIEAAENLKMKQIRLGNIILNAKRNVSLNIKDANVDKNSDNVTLDPVKVNLNPVTFKKSSGGIEIKQTQLNVSKITGDVVSKQIRVGNVIVKNLDDNDKKFSILPSQQFKIFAKDDNFIVDDLAAGEDTKDTKKTRNKRASKTDSNEKSTRSAKDRKLDKVVIVENVSLKKGFSMPNILKGGTSKIAKPRDIVISPKLNTDLPNIDIIKDDVEIGKKYRKRKLRSE